MSTQTYATAKVQKMSRSSGDGGFGSSGTSGRGNDDPWANASPATAEGARNNASFDDEPPF